VKLVDLPDLPQSGDIADFVNAHAGTDAAELRRTVESLANVAEPIPSQERAKTMERFEPFPVDALPEPVRSFVAAGAKAIGCDPCYVALPLLTVLAAAIGNTRRLLLKLGWTVPAILWTAIVGES